MKFRKKPVVIEAVQWTGANLEEVLEHTGVHESARDWSIEQFRAKVDADGLKIFTLEGDMRASIGDWIIRGVHHEVYPCKPDIFEKTYEPA